MDAGKRTRNTKELILETSLDLFAKYGYEAVSTQRIATELGITKGALYKHYESKRAIFDSILNRMEKTDSVDAASFNMPLSDEGPCNATIDDLIAYSTEMFKYWTLERFAYRFRRMITIEQHKSAEMQSLMRQYLTEGPMHYVQSVLSRIGVRNADVIAAEFYAPMFLLYDMDDAQNLISRHFAEMKRRIEADMGRA